MSSYEAGYKCPHCTFVVEADLVRVANYGAIVLAIEVHELKHMVARLVTKI